MIRGMSEQVVVVPGYMPLHATEPVPLHPRARRRLNRALRVARARGIEWMLVSGGAVHPPGTPYVEAEAMAAELKRLGWPVERLVLEPQARHTYTNLRNSGRIMLDRGWKSARVVTGLTHALYMGFPELSKFNERCVAALDYLPGRLQRAGPGQLIFEPNKAVLAPGRDPLDP